jgi:hypothetical protein
MESGAALTTVIFDRHFGNLRAMVENGHETFATHQCCDFRGPVRCGVLGTEKSIAAFSSPRTRALVGMTATIW